MSEKIFRYEKDSQKPSAEKTFFLSAKLHGLSVEYFIISNISNPGPSNIALTFSTQRKKKESLVTKPSLLKESLIIPEESMHFIRRSSLIFW